MTARGRSGANTVITAALAAGSTQAEAGQKAGVSERTVRRRLSDPDFVMGIERARLELLDRSLGKIAAAASLGVHTLESLLEARSEQVRLGAARALVDFAVRTSDRVEQQLGSSAERRSPDLSAEEATAAWEAIAAVRHETPIPSFDEPVT